MAWLTEHVHGQAEFGVTGSGVDVSDGWITGALVRLLDASATAGVRKSGTMTAGEFAERL